VDGMSRFAFHLRKADVILMKQLLPEITLYFRRKILISDKLQNHSKNDVISPQVMRLLKGIEFPVTAKTLQHSSTRKTLRKNDHINSLRIKTMPRWRDENKTSCLVQEMRKELRIAYGHGTTYDLGKIDAYYDES